MIAHEITRPIAPALRYEIARREAGAGRHYARLAKEALDGFRFIQPCPLPLPLQMSRHRAKIAVRALALWRSGAFDPKDRLAARRMFSRIELSARLQFVGDCVTGLDDPEFQSRVAEDATELAQLVESDRVVKLTRNSFDDLCDAAGLPISRDAEFARNGRVAWFYAPESDRHYFFA